MAGVLMRHCFGGLGGSCVGGFLGRRGGVLGRYSRVLRSNGVLGVGMWLGVVCEVCSADLSMRYLSHVA